MAFAATNEPGTCLWCGCKLRRKRKHEWDEKQQKMMPTSSYHYDGVPGYRGNGFFCTLGCAFRFACSSARGGVRLHPKTKEKENNG